MSSQPKPTEEQIELIKALGKLKDEVWNSKTTEEIIEIGKKAIELSKNIQPSTYIIANGTEKNNEKGKTQIIELLKNDFKDLENKFYSTLGNEKLAIANSIQQLIGVFAHLSSEDLIKLKK